MEFWHHRIQVGDSLPEHDRQKRAAHDLVLRRVGASVHDTWVIVDTRSTDGTQQIHPRCARGSPGRPHERPWKDFGHNRTEALELARGKGDYTLIIDADEVLIAEPGFRMPELTADAYETLHVAGESGTSSF